MSEAEFVYGEDAVDDDLDIYEPLPNVLESPVTQRLMNLALSCVDQAKELEVDSDESAQLAVDMDRQAQQAMKSLEEQRKRWVKPLQDHVKQINADFKPYVAKAEAVRSALRGKLIAWQKKKDEEIRKANEAKRREEMARALEESEQLEAEGHNDLAKEKLDRALTPHPSKLVEKGRTRGVMGSSAKVSKFWTYRIVDQSKIPNQYMKPDLGALRKAVNGGERSIPGLEIYQEDKLINS